MPSRDVELDLIGHDHTGHATRSAANNLDQLRRKMGKFNVDTNKDLKRGFARSGIDAASAFGASFLRTISAGLLGRQSFAASFAKSPVGAAAGIALGALIASKVLSTAHAAILAGLPLILGAGIVALPFIHLVKTQKGAVDKLKGQWKGFTDFISKPLKLPFLATLKEVGSGLQRLKGPFADLVKAIGPALKPLTRGVFDGIIGFVKALKPAMPGITAGLQEWGRQLPIIGQAFGAAFATILKDPKAVQAAVRKIGDAIVWVADNLPAMVDGIQMLAAALAGVIGPIGLILPSLTAMARGGIALFWNLAIAGIGALTLLVSAMAVFNPAMRPVLAALQAVGAAAEITFAGMKNKWAATDAAISKRTIVAKIQANIDDLETKIAAAKAKLKTVHNAKARAKIEATIKDLEAKAAAARHQLARVQGTRTEAKIKAEIRDLDAKTKAAKARLKTVHNAKTEAKIRANIADLQAKAAAARAELASIHGKTVTVSLITRKTTIITTKRGAAPPRSSGPVASAYAAGDHWAGAAGGSYRTGGPSSISVAAPIIDTRVFIDGSQIRTVARSTVVDENRRAAHRARVGRR